MTQLPPVVYQRTKQGIVAVESEYVLDDDGTVGVRLGHYNPAQALVIDPAIIYAGYFSGSTGPDVATAIAHDSQGNVYLAGYAYSVDFPIVGNAENNTETGDRDIWAIVLSMTSPPGQALVYSTFVGGTLADDLKGMTVDSNGLIYLTGSTASIDFPVTTGAYISTETVNTHAYVTVIDPTQLGTAGLIYSSYLGGSGSDDEATAIAVAGGKSTLRASPTRAISQWWEPISPPSRAPTMHSPLKSIPPSRVTLRWSQALFWVARPSISDAPLRWTRPVTFI